jgi:L-asparaginase / beta-aspartyl-peptidase
MKNISIAIHGGAGTILKSALTTEMEQEYKHGLQLALDSGYELLEAGSSAVDATEMAVSKLENCHLFNAGKGAVFTAEGTHEMDAAIMDGSSLAAGAVSSVAGVKNPIQLAKMVMDKSEHVFLSGKGAEEFARSVGCEFGDEEYFYDELRYQQLLALKGTDKFQLDHSPLKENKFGTVGAVALDQFGNIAAATSTGGMTNKKFGRIGDSPMIGAGTYANNATCAISCTGSGEYFIRAVVAYDVACLMEHKNASLAEASKEVIQHRLKNIGGDGGLIGIDAKGNIVLEFNTEGMYRGAKNANGLNKIEIYR